MTEPKYKVGDWILLTDNNIIEYTKTMDGLHYGYYQTEPYIGKEDWFDDGNVIGIIKIIPITDKPYCKDCNGDIKPLITCEQCSKWKTVNCNRYIWEEDDSDSREPDPDDHCKDATPKDDQKESK